MDKQFTATVYCQNEAIASKAGDDLDKLYTWMLIQVNGHSNDIRGEIIDNQTHAILRTFCKTAIE
jgi:hypothetical protein